jgi:two-component system, chemotaxis family, sensor kinase CheA
MSTTQIQIVKNKIRASIEEMAEQLVMADLSDSSVLEMIYKNLTGISGDLRSYFPRCSEAALAAGKLLKDSLQSNQGLIDTYLKAVEDTICSLQQLVNQNPKDDEIVFPEIFNLSNNINDSHKNTFKRPAAGVDQEIMEEYLAHQELVVSEIEDLVLAYEQKPGSEILKELKRLLHTAKGEAGVIGFYQIEQVCHLIEDYIQKEEHNLQADLLLEFKDWFEQMILAVRNGKSLPEADNLIRALQKMPEKNVDRTTTIDDGQFFDTEAKASQDEYLEPLVPVSIEDPEITAEFISEAIEHFEISDENLMILEKDPENEEAIASIFRAFHTIKGTTSFLGLVPLSKLAHKAENLLDEVRKKRLSFKGLVVDATFNAFDLLKIMIKQLEEALLAGKDFVPDPGLPDVLIQLTKALVVTQDDSYHKERSLLGTENHEADKNLPEAYLVEGEITGTHRETTTANSGSSSQAGKTVRQTMKIDADRIDLLLETIGELVIMESIVSRNATMRNGEFHDMDRNLAQLTKITRSLQDMSMSMRLIPIDTMFRKMSRLVRDLCKKTDKKIELIMEGKETELDKSMVEKLGDPLVHMIRNAVDHGIEETAQRIAEGKDPVGKIILKAYHQGGNIHIDISDDGRGLNKEKIIAKAIERGIIRGTENMSDEDIFALIFEPGFSTAQQVTDVSGRGVGMDVVKNNIESVRGNVRIVSEMGRGSTFTLVLPLTMAIIDGMIVRVGSERYILPLLSIIESFQPTREMISTVSGKGEMVPFRKRLLPLFRLSSLYDIYDAQTDPTKALVVVIEDTGRRIALLVDELLGQNQTVIKNLGEGLGDVEGIAGASIMPDGKPGLIIDVSGLVKLATS